MVVAATAAVAKMLHCRLFHPTIRGVWLRLPISMAGVVNEMRRERGGGGGASERKYESTIYKVALSKSVIILLLYFRFVFKFSKIPVPLYIE